MCYGQGGACTTITTARLCPHRISATEPGAENGLRGNKDSPYAMDTFNTFDEFVARRLRQNETVDEFLSDLHRLTRLVGEPLPERWMTCVFVSGLPQHVRQFLRASSRMEIMTLEQLLTRACAVMTDNQGQIDPIVVATQASRSNVRTFPKLDPSTSIVCYNCKGQGHLARDYPSRRQGARVRCYRCNKAGHLARDYPGNENRDEMASISSPDNQ